MNLHSIGLKNFVESRNFEALLSLLMQSIATWDGVPIAELLQYFKEPSKFPGTLQIEIVGIEILPLLSSPNLIS